MTRLAEAWRRTAARKNSLAGRGPVSDTGHAIEAGERWMTALFEEYDLTGEDMDVAGGIIMKLSADTTANLKRMQDHYRKRGQAPLPEAMVAMTLLSAGFSNGLALGLELGSEPSNNQTGGES